MRSNTWNVFKTFRTQIKRTTGFVHSVIFGRRNLLLTNALISASMGAIGDSIQQNFDILMDNVHKKNDDSNESKKSTNYSTIRTVHMTTAGLSTGVLTHYWYLLLERFYGTVNRPQLINFALLPLRYRILFDNIISLGFDIYAPYVKYKKPLREQHDSS
ncbi:hypothetical protein DERP_004927 [Dermatophagoides pteronyssinus]|uniref:Mpv17-like protein 2 n=1 Tax=Dermatophagoides pteronyssinus TaxID=6956 RepID=A0ABQ8JTG7_DERPT|nr:hypothetical protein DERP_004927 [Dermatophagoides pteronyssinus]